MPLHAPAMRLCSRHTSSALLALGKGGRLRPRVEMRVTKARTRAFALDSPGESVHRKPTLRTRFRESATPILLSKVGSNAHALQIRLETIFFLLHSYPLRRTQLLRLVITASVPR